MFDLIIRGATVTDPLSGLNAVSDIAVDGNQIVELAPEISGKALREICAQGLVAQPGIIDTHLHLAPHPLSSAMVAQAGVCTCIEMAGTPEKVFADLHRHSAGINVAVLNAFIPGGNIRNNDPDMAEIESFIAASLEAGALGVKILGGHFPLTPEASARVIEAAHKHNVYVAWHAGSTRFGSNLEGCRESFELAQGRPFHLAHVNAYCRGRIMNEIDECREVASLLEAHPEVVTESYLSARNGCPLALDDQGRPRSKIVSAQLAHFGFTQDREGIISAIKAQVLAVITETENGLGLVTGERGVALFEAGLVSDGSFDRVNPLLSRVFFACARRRDGTFLVDAISTDGGAIPRNVIVELGTELIDFAALTRLEFAAKTSLLPARMLNLTSKGALQPGFDADITIYDPVTHRTVHTLCDGRLIYSAGRLNPSRSTVLTTLSGMQSVHNSHLWACPIRGGVAKPDRRLTPQ